MTWQQATRRAAKQAALEDDRRAIGWPESDPRLPAYAYRWEHVKQVVRNGQWLLRQHPDADAEIVLAACWLHDVRKRDANHAVRGAAFANRFLPTIGFPAHKVPRVAQAIRLHEGMWRPTRAWKPADPGPMPVEPPIQPLEAALLWDADKLSKVGPLALLHWLPHYIRSLGNAEKSITTEELLEQNREWLKLLRQRTVPSLNTDAARQRAEQLLRNYEGFWAAANQEFYAI